MAGIRKVLLLIAICVSFQVGLKAQFVIDNQSPCDWDVELHVAYYPTCNYLSPPISVVAAANTQTTVNVANYYPCAACRVAEIRIYGQGGGTFVEVFDYFCGSQKALIGDCPYGGLWYAEYFPYSYLKIYK